MPSARAIVRRSNTWKPYDGEGGGPRATARSGKGNGPAGGGGRGVWTWPEATGLERPAGLCVVSGLGVAGFEGGLLCFGSEDFGSDGLLLLLVLFLEMVAAPPDEDSQRDFRCDKEEEGGGLWEEDLGKEPPAIPGGGEFRVPKGGACLVRINCNANDNEEEDIAFH